MTSVGWSFPKVWDERPRSSRSDSADVLPVGALRDLVGAAAAERRSDVVFRGRLTTHQLLPNGRDYDPLPSQVQVACLTETAYQVSTEFMVWQQGDCVRLELLDGSPVLIHDGRTRWKIHYWPTDIFFCEDAPGTALREDDFTWGIDPLRLPPLPADHARLLAGVDPIGEVTAGRYRDTAAWKFTMPIDIDPRDPRRDQPGYTSIIAADTGYLLRDWWDTMPQSEWSDIAREVTVPADHFRWTGPERSLESRLPERDYDL